MTSNNTPSANGTDNSSSSDFEKLPTWQKTAIILLFVVVVLSIIAACRYYLGPEKMTMITNETMLQRFILGML